MKRAITGFLGLALVACGSAQAAPTSHTIKGSFQVVEQLGLGSGNELGQPCIGTGGFDDIHQGTSVVVRDDSNKVLATGALSPGRIVASETCGFDFTVNDVPEANFYQIEVSHRGEVTFSKTDISQKNWYVSLSLA